MYYEYDGVVSVKWGRCELRAWWSSVCQMGQMCTTSMVERCLSDGADMYYEHNGVVSVRWGRCELRAWRSSVCPMGQICITSTME